MKFRSTYFMELTPDHGGGPQISASADTQRWTRSYGISGDPDKVQQALIDFLGVATIKNQGPTKYISRLVPHCVPWRRSDGLNYLWAVSATVNENCTIEGAQLIQDARGGFPAEALPSYRWAKLSVMYTTLKHILLDDDDPHVQGTGPYAGIPDEGQVTNGPSRFTTQFTKPWIKFATLPKSLMKYVPVSASERVLSVTEGAAYTEAGQIYTVIWHGVPSAAYPASLVGRYLGTINQFQFLGAPAETMLFESTDPAPIVLANGDSALDVTYTFRRKDSIARTNTGDAPFTGVKGVTPRGWNWYPRYLAADSPLWDFRPMSSDGTLNGTPAYLTNDFAKLFRAP